ncbi:MAG: dihydrolipoyl dehydrogenase [Rhodobacter sp.]|nr:dihydrolipoyl dehydrogenase [Rhodobacter sp.]
MKTEHCEVLIIGAGPGGYVCGIRAGQLGLDTIVLEQARPGGTCLNVGCIPSKALIHAADAFHRLTHFAGDTPLGIAAGPAMIDLGKTQAWKDRIVGRLNQGVVSLLKKAKTRLVEGRAQILDGKTVLAETADGPVRIACENLVLATGSRPADLPNLPFGGKVITSTEALSLSEIPKGFAIVGGGYIGLEIGTAMAKLGSNVTIVEAADRVLPQYDAALTKPVEARLTELNIALHTDAKAKGQSEAGDLRVDASGAEFEIPCDKILVTIGRAPNTHGFGLEGLGLTMAGPHVEVDDVCATSMRRVFAIGDLTGDPMLAHRAMAQGVIVAEHIAGLPSVWDKRAMPAVCFTDPEIVVVGDLPSSATAASVFPFAANGRAMTMARADGFVRVVYDPETELVLGLQAVGAGASELAGEFALAIEMCATLTDIASTVHAHPTLGETVQEVSHMALGHALHI